MRPLKISAAVLCWLLIILAILFTVLDIQLSPESGAQQRFLRFYSEYGTEERFGIEPKQCAAALMAMPFYLIDGMFTRGAFTEHDAPTGSEARKAAIQRSGGSAWIRKV